jgi:hypothetical protein
VDFNPVVGTDFWLFARHSFHFIPDFNHPGTCRCWRNGWLCSKAHFHCFLDPLASPAYDSRPNRASRCFLSKKTLTTKFV